MQHVFVIGESPMHQYANVIQLLVKNKGLQRKEASKEFSKYARAQLEQIRQTEKV